MQIMTKSDGALHYVNTNTDFTELLYAYMGQDAANAFRDFLTDAVEASSAVKDRDNLSDLRYYVVRNLLPAIAREVRRFRNHPDMDERLEKWAEAFDGKMEDLYGNDWNLE